MSDTLIEIGEMASKITQLRAREAVLVEALTNSDSLLRMLTGPDDLVAGAALDANRKALATLDVPDPKEG